MQTRRNFPVAGRPGFWAVLGFVVTVVIVLFLVVLGVNILLGHLLTGAEAAEGSVPGALPRTGKAEAQERMTLISDAPNPSPFFLNFFFHLNQTMQEWWNREGRSLVKTPWTISASELHSETGESLGVSLTITQKGPFRPRRVAIRATRNPEVSAELAAAVAIGEIERRSGKAAEK